MQHFNKEGTGLTQGQSLQTYNFRGGSMLNRNSSMGSLMRPSEGLNSSSMEGGGGIEGEDAVE